MLPRFVIPKITVIAVAAAFILAAGFTAFNVVPAASEDASLLARKVDAQDQLVDPWSGLWGSVRPVTVALSAQNATKPFGGGTVATLKARALQDGKKLYVMVEWNDKTVDDAVNGQRLFSDATAVEFPATPGVSLPSFCMGDANGSVNIWQWKAVWQKDIDVGFASVRDRYPNRFADEFPFVGDDTFQAARAAGNIVSQRQHVAPVENVVAAAFGTLTTADVQDVSGVGRWSDGHWRVVYSRSLTTAPGYPSLAVGDTTNIAFAVWDGSREQRDGIKSVSQFMNLRISADVLAAGAGGSLPVWAWAAVAAGGAALILAILALLYGPMSRSR